MDFAILIWQVTVSCWFLLCSKRRKGILKYVCEITEISKGHSRANIAPETTCNSRSIPKEVAHVGSVPLTAFTLWNWQQQQILLVCNLVTGDSKTLDYRKFKHASFNAFTEIAHSNSILFSVLSSFLRTLCNWNLVHESPHNYYSVSMWRNESRSRWNAFPEYAWDTAALGVHFQDNVDLNDRHSGVFFFNCLKIMYNLDNSVMHYHCLVDPGTWQLLIKQVAWAITQIQSFKVSLGIEQLKTCWVEDYAEAEWI